MHAVWLGLLRTFWMPLTDRKLGHQHGRSRVCPSSQKQRIQRALTKSETYRKGHGVFCSIERLKSKIRPRNNQYGGVSGCGTTQYLLQAWHEILEAMEDEGAAVSLISIDFDKAFNTMEHQACIETVLRHGATVHTTRLVSSFLHNRKMRFKVDGVYSTEWLFRGGSPQGTLLGNFLFVIATDCLEDKDETPVILDRAGAWDPEAVMFSGSPIRQRPSAIFPGLHGVVTSSPAPNNLAPFKPEIREPPEMPEEENEDSTFRYFQNFRRPYNRICDSVTRTLFSVSDTAVNEANPRPNGWIDVPMSILKYVDDFLGHEKISTHSGCFHFTQSRSKISIHARKCQAFFETVSKNVKNIGMSVNARKTQILCISSSAQTKVTSFIETNEERIESQASLKILGFTFGDKPTVAAHIGL